MYRDEKRSWMKHLDFTILDMLMMELALILAYGWRFEHAWLFNHELYVRIAVIALLIDVCVVFFSEAYTGILRRNKYQELRSTVTHCAVVWGGVLVYMYATKTSVEYSRQMLFVFLGLFIILSYFSRVVLKRVIRKRKLEDQNKAWMLVVADTHTVEQCLNEIAHDKYTDFKVSGVVVIDKDMRGQTIQGIPVVASADTFMEYLRTNVVDEVFINGNTRSSSEALAAEMVELGITAHISLINTKQMGPNRRIENYGSFIVLTSSMHIANARQLFVKRLMDIAGGIVGLALTAIAFVIFAPIIKIQSPGPVFFKQVRIGKNGRRFNFYKFRSMCPNAEAKLDDLLDQNEMDGPVFKIKDDPRITRVGKFIRKTSIDELPQLWNILKGDMSIVGPRPALPREVEQYGDYEKQRLYVTPGLSCYWQIAPHRNDLSFEEWMDLDVKYVKERSFWVDWKIIFKTFKVCLLGHGE